MIDKKQPCPNCDEMGRLAIRDDFPVPAMEFTNPNFRRRHNIENFSIMATFLCVNPECPIKFFNLEFTIAAWKKNLVPSQKEALAYAKTMFSMIGRICKKETLGEVFILPTNPSQNA